MTAAPGTTSVWAAARCCATRRRTTRRRTSPTRATTPATTRSTSSMPGTPRANWDGRRVLYDHSGNGGNGGGEGMPQADLEPKCGAGIDDGGQVYGPFYEDGFSPILDTKGRTPSVQDPTKLKYFVQFEIQ